MSNRSKVAAVVAEFLGVAALTMILLAISKSGVGFSLFIAGGVGLGVAFLSLIMGAASGAHYNPAVTIGLWTTRKITTSRALVFVAAQLLGGVAAWKIYNFLVAQPLASIAPKTFDWKVFWAEALGGMLIALAYSAAVYKREWGTRYAATIGGGVFLGMMVASLASNGIANPAIALGMRSWSTAYVAGPILGGLIGANIYTYLFAPADELGSTVAARAAARARGGSTSAPVNKPAGKKSSKKKK